MKAMTSKIALIGIAAIAMTGCGPLKEDPTADYAVEKKATENERAQSRKQKLPPEVRIEAKEAMDFKEGASESYPVTPYVIVPGAKYSLVLEATSGALPEGLEFQENKPGHAEKGYTISWTPKVGTVALGAPNKKFYVVAKIVLAEDSSADAKKALANILLEKKIRIEVEKISERPTIRVTKASDEVVQGESVAITVEAEDQAAREDQAPKIEIVNPRSKNADDKYVPAKSFVEVTKETAKDGKFYYELLLNTNQVVVPAKSESVDVRFVTYVKSKSPSGFESAAKEVSIKVLKKVNPAVDAGTGAKP